jgi:hypothetical protein
MPLFRVAWSLAALLLLGCATFNSEMAKPDLTKAQEYVETEEQFRRLAAEYLAKAQAIPIHIRRVDPSRAEGLLKEWDLNRTSQGKLGALFERMAVFTFAMGGQTDGLLPRWKIRGRDVRFVTEFTDPQSLALFTGEASPEECRTEQSGPNFPILADLLNPSLKVIGLPLFDTKPHDVAVCPSKYQEARVAPLATGLSLALDPELHAKEVELPYSHHRSSPLAVMVEPALTEARVVICAHAQSWSGGAQLAIRYEASLGELDRFFANEAKVVPIEKAPFERSVVFVTVDRRFSEGGDAAVDCLSEPFDSPLGARIVAMKAARRKRLEAASPN